MRNIEHLVTFEPMIGMVRNAHHVFLARGAELVADPTELNEGKFQWLPLSDVPELIRTGKIVNSGSLEVANMAGIKFAAEDARHDYGDCVRIVRIIRAINEMDLDSVRIHGRPRGV